MAITKRLDDRDLEGLPGIGPATKTQLNKIGINRISDLILFLPTFLIDKTKLSDISSVSNGDSCLFIGKIIKKSSGYATQLNDSFRHEIDYYISIENIIKKLDNKKPPQNEIDKLKWSKLVLKNHKLFLPF